LDKKWRIGAVSYLNTRPLLLGMEQSPFRDSIDLVKSYPAQIAQALLDDTIDIGLVPVAIMPLLKNPQVISKYVIGTEGKVASVALFSQVSIDQIQKVYLDYQSRTSVALAKILFKQYWNKEVEFLIATEGYINEISGTTAGVIIGDRALTSLNRFEHIYDLGLAWKTYTGLPFVFAAWVANKPIPAEFIEAFDVANGYGLNHLDEVISLIPANEQEYDLYKYYTENISYKLTPEKKKGLELFLELIKNK
jgi:chorismate dehydratase